MAPICSWPKFERVEGGPMKIRTPSFVQRILARLMERFFTVVFVVVLAAGASYLGVTVDQAQVMELLGVPAAADGPLEQDDGSADQWFGGELDGGK